jgi:FKBP-type peptidyl-prolyl cis-trans isomerase FkpA
LLQINFEKTYASFLNHLPKNSKSSRIFAKNIMMKILPILSLFLILCACSDKEQTDYLAQNETEIVEYLSANGLTAQKTDSGLHYIIDRQGTGARPSTTSNVTVVYKGYYLNGSVFDQSDSNGLSIGLNQVIPGWTEGISLFNEGGKGMLFIPSHLGYGSSDFRDIPGGSVLIFDIELLSIN